MAITEEVRHKVYEAIRASHGDEVANGLMEMLPPVGWADVATKHDLSGGLGALEERMGLRMEALEARLGERLESSLKDIQQEMREQANRFIGWVVGAAGLSVAAASLISRVG